MRILFVVDQNRYSARIIPQVARLALNTWADITLLGVQSKTSEAKHKSEDIYGWQQVNPSFAVALHDYRDTFINCFHDEESPYSPLEYDYQLVEIQRGVYEELYVGCSSRKHFIVRIRPGKPARAILAEAIEEGSDLIVLGCDPDTECRWKDWGNVPLKVAAEATCSVLVLKEEKIIKKILCCLDHDLISQDSLEMISQMVTLYRAELYFVGLTDGAGLKNHVEQRLDWILKYYTARKIKPLIELVALSSLEAFISQEARWGLMALWMGKKSILEKVFMQNIIARLLKKSKSSVLLLR